MTNPNGTWIRPIDEMPERLRSDLASKGIFKCHYMTTPCSHAPEFEVQRKDERTQRVSRSIYCREHAKQWCEMKGIQMPTGGTQ